MTDFRGPNSGYISDAKQKYRHDVWSAIAPKVKDLFQIDDRAHVLLLPSKGGEEIAVAIEHGIPQERIIAVDENSALIASAPWRKTFPMVKCYGSSLSRAAERIKNDGHVLLAANLDLCNNFSEDLVSEVSGFFNSLKRFDKFIFSITVMKGRENKATNMMLNHIFKSTKNGLKKIEDKRIRALCAIMQDDYNFPLFGLSCVESQGAYIHSKTPMAWCVFSCGFNDNLIKIMEDLHEFCKKYRDITLDFFRKKPTRYYEPECDWPQKEEDKCIEFCITASEKVKEYFDCLESMGVIDETAEMADRFLITQRSEGNLILQVIRSSDFAWWSHGRTTNPRAD